MTIKQDTNIIDIDAILIHLKRLAIEGEQDSRGHHCIARNKCNAIIDSITNIQKHLRKSTQRTKTIDTLTHKVINKLKEKLHHVWTK